MSDALVVPMSIGPHERRPTTEHFLRAIAQRHGLDQREVLDPHCRTTHVVWARHELRWLMRHALPDLSLAQISRKLDGADHTTVMNSLARVDQRMERDPDYRTEMRTQLELLNAWPAAAGVGPEAAEEAGGAGPEAEELLPSLRPDLAALKMILESRQLSDRNARRMALVTLDALAARHG